MNAEQVPGCAGAWVRGFVERRHRRRAFVSRLPPLAGKQRQIRPSSRSGNEMLLIIAPPTSTIPLAILTMTFGGNVFGRTEAFDSITYFVYSQVRLVLVKARLDTP
jgi:hypothetical protein